LRTQLSAVRQKLERESLAYGELRAQAARHETIARQTLMRAEEAETRARDLLRELGGARQKMAQLAAEFKQRQQPACSVSPGTELPTSPSTGGIDVEACEANIAGARRVIDHTAASFAKRSREEIKKEV
jgi:hypothetical protein